MKNETEIQFDKDRYNLYKFPQEEFALKYAQPWPVGDTTGWLVSFGTQVRGGMKIMNLSPNSTVTLDKLVDARASAIRKRIPAEGGKLISLNTTPVKFCGFPGKKIEQRFTFTDIKQPIVCKTYIAIGNKKAFLLDLAAPEYLYKDKTYAAMLDECVSSAGEIPKGVRVTKLQISDSELEGIVSEAISNLKELKDPTRKITYKYPSTWKIRKPYVLAEGETVILFDSPNNDLIRGSITCKEVFPRQTLESLSNELASPKVFFGRYDIEKVKNEPCTFAGHQGRQIITKMAMHDVMTDVWRRSVSYVALANGKIYEFNVNAPDAAFSKVQKLVDAMLPSIKF